MRHFSRSCQNGTQKGVSEEQHMLEACHFMKHQHAVDVGCGNIFTALSSLTYHFPKFQLEKWNSGDKVVNKQKN